ncbi:helix-turn-helix domain-containing protein [Dactylosporangium darangshiense]|uniref:Helix-turn-helix domain-containing protein n=1 Tax=Dactylosporangium darangshiense TaxID=579108 RepID=A0ABP8DMW0_9ACTN
MNGDAEVRPLLRTVAEAAIELRVGKNTVKKMIKSGELSSITIGVSRRIPADEVREYLRRKLRQAAVARGEGDDEDLPAA